MNTAKIKGALEEAAWAFCVFFAISFFGWVSGWTVLPDVGAATAALKAAAVGGAAAAAKGIVWAFTTRTQ